MANEIIFPRGDTKKLKFKINIDETPYVPASGDRIYLTVKTRPNVDEFKIQKVYPETITYNSEDNYFRLTIEPEDTNDLKVMEYYYDIQANLIENNFVKTFIVSTLTLSDEITFSGNEVE